MSLTGPPVYYFLSLSSVSVLNMEGGAGTCLKGKGGESCWPILRSWFVMLGPRALNLLSQQRLQGKARGDFVRGFQPSASFCVVSVCENAFLWDCWTKQHAIECIWCMVLCVYYLCLPNVCHHDGVWMTWERRVTELVCFTCVTCE